MANNNLGGESPSHPSDVEELRRNLHRHTGGTMSNDTGSPETARYDLKASCTLRLGWNIWIFPHGKDYPIVEMGIPDDKVENYVALFGLSMDEVGQARFDIHDRHDTTKDDRARNDELRELVDSWREKADEFQERGFDSDYYSYTECADELEELIEGRA